MCISLECIYIVKFCIRWPCELSVENTGFLLLYTVNLIGLYIFRIEICKYSPLQVWRFVQRFTSRALCSSTYPWNIRKYVYVIVDKILQHGPSNIHLVHEAGHSILIGAVFKIFGTLPQSLMACSWRVLPFIKGLVWNQVVYCTAHTDSLTCCHISVRDMKCSRWRLWRFRPSWIVRRVDWYTVLHLSIGPRWLMPRMYCSHIGLLYYP